MSFVEIAVLLAVALLAGAVGWVIAAFWHLRRGEERDPRRMLRGLVRRRVRAGRAGFMRICRGVWVHLVPEPVPLEDGLRPAEVFLGVAGLTAEELPPGRVVFTASPYVVWRTVVRALEDIGVAPVGGAPAPTPDDPFGTVRIAEGHLEHEIELGPLVAEAAGTVSLLSRLAADRARVAQVELQVLEAFRDEVESTWPGASVSVAEGTLTLRRPGGDTWRLPAAGLPTRLSGGRDGWQAWLSAQEDLTGEVWITRRVRPVHTLAAGYLGEDRGGWAEVYAVETGRSVRLLEPGDPEATGDLAARADADLDRSSFSAHLVITTADSPLRSLTLVGPDIASLAAHPDLLAGVADISEAFDRGTRVRVRAEHTAVLVLAEARADEAFLSACRRAGHRLAEALGLPAGGALSLDITAPLGPDPRGRFDLFRVDDHFFAAALKERTARARGDLAGAAEARGVMRFGLGDPEGARLHLAEASRLRPEDPELLKALGTLHNDLGEYAAAEAVLRRAVGLLPEDAAVNNNLGVAYQGLGRLAEASLFFAKAAEIRPEDPVVQVNIGRLYLDSGEADAAERAFQRALDLAPNLVEGLAGLVQVAVREGDTLLARRRLNEALAVAPTHDLLLRLHRALHPDEPLQ